MKTIMITGASSGIGKASAKFFAEKGWQVAATMRTPANETELTEIENISLYPLDVTKAESISTAAENIIRDMGTVDVVLNNAGYGLMGAFEATTLEQVRYQYEVNVFGLMEVTRAFLPHFRSNQAGMFINISSIGGLITFPFISLYHSTKWAVEGFSESLSFELAELGIAVKVVEPGAVATDFAGRSMVMAQNEAITDYNLAFGKMMASMQARQEQRQASTGADIAAVIYEAATDGKKQLRYLAGADAEQMAQSRREAGDDAFMQDIAQMIF